MIAHLKVPLLVLTGVTVTPLTTDWVGLLGEGILILGLLAAGVYIYRHLPGWWDAHMKARHARFVASQGESVREIALKQKVQDILKQGISKAVEDQEISQKEETKTINWLKVALGMPDLHPGKTNKEIKEKLKAERSAAFGKNVRGFKAGGK